MADGGRKSISPAHLLFNYLRFAVTYNTAEHVTRSTYKAIEHVTSVSKSIAVVTRIDNSDRCLILRNRNENLS